MSGDGRVVVSGSEDMTIRRWDAQTGSQLVAPLRSPECSMSDVAVCGDGKIILTQSSNTDIRRMDVEGRSQVYKPLQGHEVTVRCDNGRAVVVLGRNKDKKQ